MADRTSLKYLPMPLMRKQSTGPAQQSTAAQDMDSHIRSAGLTSLRDSFTLMSVTLAAGNAVWPPSTTSVRYIKTVAYLI